MTLTIDALVYYQPDEAVIIGALKQGAQVRVGKVHQQNRVAYILMRGDGPFFGWLERDTLYTD